MQQQYATASRISMETNMAHLTDQQLLAIFEDTEFLLQRTAIWDSLTPKQRLRAEMLAERKDDNEVTKYRLKGINVDEE